MEVDEKFVQDVVKQIVDTPDNVKTERKVDEMGVLIELTVDPTDMGKIIGKEGKTAKALRTLLRVLGAKSNSRINLKIIEPEGSERPPRTEDSAPTETKEEVTEEVKEESVSQETSRDEEKAEDVLEDVPTDVLE